LRKGAGRSASAVRIGAGRWKGRRLDVPPGARPTSGRAREALFDLLQDRLRGARLLDLYAGSGAVGLEAVSRGAARAVLVEPDAAALRRNLALLAPGASEVELLAAPASIALSELARRGERFDVIFADPPYGLGLAAEIRSGPAAWLAPGGLLVLQADAGSAEPEPEGLRLARRRAYGRNVFHFFETGSAPDF
jgi:16S rRNA (guanine(966)-N(2))-methyltransferase RsmD